MYASTPHTTPFIINIPNAKYNENTQKKQTKIKSVICVLQIILLRVKKINAKKEK